VTKYLQSGFRYAEEHDAKEKTGSFERVIKAVDNVITEACSLRVCGGNAPIALLEGFKRGTATRWISRSG
jgi:hypothetical protein